MWIPRPLYEALPYLWIAAGALLVLVPFAAELPYRSTSLALGALCLVIGLVFWMRRRDFRALQARFGRSLDE